MARARAGTRARASANAGTIGLGLGMGPVLGLGLGQERVINTCYPELGLYYNTEFLQKLICFPTFTHI